MKKILTFATVCILTVQSHAETPAQQAVAYYQKGQQAEKAGNPAAAQQAYIQALKLDPKNADARYSLGQLKLNAGAIAAKGREDKIGSVVLPLYQLQDASLQEALTALQLGIEKQSKDEVTPNFVIDDPGKKLADQKISLNLKNMPARELIKYVLDQVGAKARYDEHAVVVSAK